jgi:hypothetical protein
METVQIFDIHNGNLTIILIIYNYNFNKCSYCFFRTFFLKMTKKKNFKINTFISLTLRPESKMLHKLK